MASKDKKKDPKNILADCLAIYRRNVATAREDAGLIFLKPVVLNIHRDDCSEWRALMTQACEIPALCLVGKKSVEQAILQIISEPGRDSITNACEREFLAWSFGETQSFCVQRPVWGIEFDSSSQVLELGPFLLGDRRLHEIDTPLPGVLEMAAAQQEKDAPNTWVATTVSARDQEKALEIADTRFEKLEEILNFLLPAQKQERRIAIIHPDVGGVATYRISSHSSGSVGGSAHGGRAWIRADNTFFRRPSAALQRLLALVQEIGAITDLEEALLYAVKWCSQSRLSQDPATAFVQAAIALEAVFPSKYGRGGLSGRLAFNVAHILGSTIDECIHIEQRVAKNYHLRSEGVHGNTGKDHKIIRELENWQHIVTKVLMAILTKAEYAEMKSLEELGRALQRAGYAYKGDSSPLSEGKKQQQLKAFGHG